MKNKLKIILVAIFLSGCSFSDLTDPFTNLLGNDELLFLSAYENVKIVEQDSESTGQNTHPVNISEERIEGALKLLLFRIGNSMILSFDLFHDTWKIFVTIFVH